jgi:glutamyl-tRNA synthetase
MAHKKIVTRFAPSPTGFLHIGGVRTALFAWLFARQQGSDGTFILRIEDTDKSREVSGSIQHIIDSLRWLNLDWDYGPDTPSAEFGSCLQSDRLSVYRKYAEQLLERGLAYPDPYTNDEVEAFRSQAQAEKRPFLFRNHRPDTFADWDGSQPLRFKVPDIKRYTWHDEVRGELTAGEEMVDDIILIKADGFPTYNFAHIVDDHEMGVTHVMRGEEFISSTPKFLSIIDALGFERPIFATLPPIMGPDGKKKLSKRDGAKDLLDYKNDGYLPEAMVNFLALIGWNPGTDQEILSREDLLEQFSLKKIQRSGGAFNLEKLQWMNGEYLAKLPAEEKVVYVCNALPELDKERLTKLTPTILERHNTKVEIREAYATGEYDWVQKQPEYDTQLLQWKNDESVKDAKPRLEELQTLLSAADFSSPEAIKAIVWPYAEAKGKGEVLWPLRVALSGKAQSPDPFTLAYVLGQSDTIARISNACGKI